MAKMPDKLFMQEFRQMMSDRYNMYCTDSRFDVTKIFVPDIPTLKTNIVNGVLIKGVQEPYFEKLNKTVANIEKRRAWSKREYDQYGNIRYVDGNPVTRDIAIPMGSVVISSKTQISLPNSKVIGATKRKYLPSVGFLYIDYVIKDGQKLFYYAVPKCYVYKLNLCALVLTKNMHKRAYRGYKIALQNGSYVYLYVIPFTNRGLNYRVLGLKASPNFNDEINAIVRCWQLNGTSFNYDLCKVENNNLGYSYIDGVCNSDDYRAYSESMDTMGYDVESVE